MKQIRTPARGGRHGRITWRVLAPAAACLLALSGQAAAVPIPLALKDRNIADDSTLSTIGGWVGAFRAIDTDRGGGGFPDAGYVSAATRGFELDLGGAFDLIELSAYVDPPNSVSSSSDPFKGTDVVEFFTSSNGVVFTSVGTVLAGGAGWTSNALGSFAYASVEGDFSGITHVRYLFTPENSNGTRVAEVLAFVPEPAALVLGLSGLGLVTASRRRRGARAAAG